MNRKKRMTNSVKSTIFDTNSISSTKKLGEKLAKQIVKIPVKDGAVVLALRGELGAGKTIFLQGFATGLGIKEKVTSPTFVIQKRFTIYDLRFTNFYHIDCYRLSDSSEILELGWEEIISNPVNIVAIEWPERIKDILPRDVLEINLEWVDKNKRKIMINNF